MKVFFAICLIFGIVLAASARHPRCPENYDLIQGTPLTHESDCGLFYKCDLSGNLVVQQCYPGLHFNEVSLTCDYPNQANCKEKISA